MIRIKQQNNIEYLDISNKSARAKIALQGAHVFHYHAKNKKPLLWLSNTSHFEKGKAIRGGIPICWPWFGAHKKKDELPSHGFARTALWEHFYTQEVSEYETKISLRLKSSAGSLKCWPFLFELILEVTIADSLSLSLISKNCDSKDFTITSALHSYFAISDINTVYLKGFDQKSYYNKVDNSFGNRQQGDIHFTQEVDRIYQNINAPVTLVDTEQTIQLNSTGSSTMVVWNPWKALASKMPDLSDYTTMLCVESANALDDEVRLPSGQSHVLKAHFMQ